MDIVSIRALVLLNVVTKTAPMIEKKNLLFGFPGVEGVTLSSSFSYNIQRTSRLKFKESCENGGIDMHVSSSVRRFKKKRKKLGMSSTQCVFCEQCSFRANSFNVLNSSVTKFRNSLQGFQ